MPSHHKCCMPATYTLYNVRHTLHTLPLSWMEIDYSGHLCEWMNKWHVYGLTQVYVCLEAADCGRHVEWEDSSNYGQFATTNIVV